MTTTTAHHKRALLLSLLTLLTLISAIGSGPAADASASTPVTTETRVRAIDTPTATLVGRVDPASPQVVGVSDVWLRQQASATGVATEAADDVALSPYGGPGGGHHVPAKSAFNGAAEYDANAALAVPNSELGRLGVSHARITGAQSSLYRQFAATGESLTWDSMASIERQSLIAGGMDSAQAASVVDRAIAGLKAAGVSGPTRIPWGGN